MRLGSLLIFCLFTLISLGIGCAAARDAQEVSISYREDEAPEAVQLPDSAATPLAANVRLTTTLEEPLGLPAAAALVESRSLAVTNFAFTPNVITVPANKPVEIMISVLEGEHAFVAEELGLNEELFLGKVLSFTSPSIPGRYVFYCNKGPNRGLGMEGIIVVE